MNNGDDMRPNDLRVEYGYMLGRSGGFRDANNRSCEALDVVEYEFGARRGILMDCTTDGDAYVLFRDTKDVEIVKWRSLCKVPAIDEA